MAHAFRSLVLFAASFFAAVAVLAQGAVLGPDGDMYLGALDAPVVVVEYASPTCPSCKIWRDTVFPLVKSRFVDTGLVRFVLKETPSHNKAVDAAVFAIARCVAPAQYFEVIDAAYARREVLDRASFNPDGPRTAIEDLAERFGLTGERVTACLDAPSVRRHLTAVRTEAIARGVTGTPTLLINGVIIDGADADDPDKFAALLARTVAAAQGVKR